MPWLTDLADALRAGGIGLWEAPGWRTRGHGPMSGVRGILIHHTAGGGTSDWLIVQNGRADLPGPLAHMTLERDGGVRLIAAGQCWHAGNGSHPLIGSNGNPWLIGIEGVSPGVGANTWTAAQRREYPRLAAALCRWYRLPASAVIGHKEWAPGRKIDPGDWDMNAFRAEVARLLATPAAPPPPPPEEDIMATTQELDAIVRRALLDHSRLALDGRVDVTPARRADVGYARDQLIAAITKLAGAGPDLSEDQIVAALAQGAAQAVRDQVLPVLEDVVAQALGADNEALAAEIVQLAGERLRAVA